VRRLAPTVLVIALLVATVAAFALAERLKLEPSPITRTRVDHKVFSPVCGCATGGTRISFDLRERGRMVALIVDADEQRVRMLVDEVVDAGGVTLRWDGRDDEGRVVAEGVYTPRIRLPDDKRTIAMPNPIRVDTTPPRVLKAEVSPRAFSPDGDRRLERVTVRYRVDEPARALLFVNGRQVERTRFRPLEGVRVWNGRRGGRALPAGDYELALAAEDTAGNVGERTAPTLVRIRYVELGRTTVRARVRTRFGVRVTTDARSIRWRFAGGKGTARRGLLVLRAPRRPGRFRLFVEANGHGASALVVVTRRPPS
jgi:hypothetical protein